MNTAIDNGGNDDERSCTIKPKDKDITPKILAYRAKPKSVKWMSIPYFPVSVKYVVLMIVLFFVGTTGTSLSKFEAFAISFVAYSVAMLLDRVEGMAMMATTLVRGAGGD